MTATLHDRVTDQARLLVRLIERLNAEHVALSEEETALVERLLDGLEGLHHATLRIGATATDEPRTLATIDAKRHDYQALVERFRARVSEATPSGSIVAVVSRGDPALVELAGRTGWHFPQNYLGVWAGYHPATGRDALEQVLELVGKGARYLAIPAPSRWWLDFYTELRDHLACRAREILSDDDGALYELAAVVDQPLDAATRQYHLQIGQFIDFAEALLPPSARLLVISRGDDAFLATRFVRATHFPSSGGVYAGHPADSEQAIAMLAADIAAGADHLAIPAPLRWWTAAYPAFSEHLWHAHRCVADQAEVAQIFQLTPSTTG